MKQKTAKLIVSIFNYAALTIVGVVVCSFIIALIIVSWKAMLSFLGIFCAAVALCWFYDYCKEKAK